MKSVLVTGGCGFIGSNLVKRLMQDNVKVDVVDDLSNGQLDFLPEGFDTENCLYVADFSASHILDNIRSRKYDTIFHIAAVPRVSYSVEFPIETHETNVNKTLQLMEAAKNDNVNRFVFASSSSVYGGADASLFTTEEEHAKNPKSPYALQKSIIEDYLKLYSELYSLDSVCLRFFNVFGPNQLGNSPYATAIAAWLTAIKSGLPMRSDGDGEQSRDMCYVDNVVDACVRAAKLAVKTNARCYNVACGEKTSNNQILQYIKARYPEAKVVHAPERPGDVKHTWASIMRSQFELGYQPIVRVWQGIDNTIDWYEENWETKLKHMFLKT